MPRNLTVLLKIQGILINASFQDAPPPSRLFASHIPVKNSETIPKRDKSLAD